MEAGDGKGGLYMKQLSVAFQSLGTAAHYSHFVIGTNPF